MMGYGMMGFGWMWIWIVIIAVIVIGVIAYLAVKSSNSNGNKQDRHQESNQALEILKQKYANGEITEEEYLRKKEILKK